ncbi:MAG: response regulator [Deltaproteobacteria bacterium]|nr:response regulator [Deltaproteobacteria bacterium]
MKKVLICDDESLILMSLSSAVRMLSGYPVEVHAVPTGGDALDEARAQTFDLCFLDIRLPDVSGLDVMKEIRARSPGTVIVVISACEVTGEMMSLIAENEARFIPKPFEIAQIQDALRAVA